MQVSDEHSHYEVGLEAASNKLKDDHGWQLNADVVNSLHASKSNDNRKQLAVSKADGGRFDNVWEACDSTGLAS